MEEKIIKLISEVKEDESLVSAIYKDTNIIDDIGLDSLQMINFMLRIEEETGVEIDFDIFDFSNLSSVQIFAEYLEERI
ncbi:MAG: acyl carrier protein [Firmicutes bacterium]|nr:acyl carrier protein [Bacillota bacterium]